MPTVPMSTNDANTPSSTPSDIYITSAHHMPGIHCGLQAASRPVSRVLSFKATICLGAPLPIRSSHPSERITPSKRGAFAPLRSVLLRIGFAGQCGSPHAGELLPRLSTLTRKSGRYISVALSLRSPSAAVSRYSALYCSDFPHTDNSARNCQVNSLLLF